MEEDKNPFQQDDIENTENIEQEQEEPLQEEEKKEAEENKEDKKYDDLNNKYIRLAADFDNHRKRTQTQLDEISTYAKIDVLKKIITVLDTFERAKDQLKDIDNPDTIKEGYEVVFKQFQDTLSKIGLSEIEALGKPFDAAEHEAITQVQTEEFEPDTVALVAQKGYKFQDKVVRPAFVGVAVEKQ